MIKFDKLTSIYDNIYYTMNINDCYIGSLEMEIDGFYNWIPPSFGQGYFPAHILYEIANKLTELNREYQLQLEDDLQNLPNTNIDLFDIVLDK